MPGLRFIASSLLLRFRPLSSRSRFLNPAGGGGTSVIGDLEAAAVGTRRQAGDALEEAAEEGRLLVAHLPAYFIDRGFRPLQAALGASILRRCT